MAVRAQSLGWWVIPLVLVAGLAAAAEDLRLVNAVKNRDTVAVRALLKERADVNAPQPDGATALHWAAHWDDVETADLLIGAGAHVNAANHYGVTPLSLACTNGNGAMVEKLLKAGANPNAALPTGETALMTCARTGKVDAVTALVSRGVDVNAKETGRGQTALMWALAEGHAEVARVLIEHGADVHARSTAGVTPLLFAARKADPSTIQVLLAAGVDVNEATPDGTTALVTASVRGETALAKFLLERAADPNLGPGFTPLHWAAGWFETELSNTTTGILAEDTEWSTLGGFQGEEKLEFVKLLLAHGADPNLRAETSPRPYVGGTRRARGGNLAGGNAFTMAAKTVDLAVMRVLLTAGAAPLVATTQGTTPLMLAAGVGYTQGKSWGSESAALEAVKLCVELGGDVNAVNAAGETALHGAAYRERGEAIVQFLVDRGAKLNVKNKRGWTPLTIAEGFYTSDNYIRAPGTAALLVKLGAEPSPPDVVRVPVAGDR